MNAGTLPLPVDHMGVLGTSIEALTGAWRRLGFTVVGPEELRGVDETGHETGLGQYSAHVMFENDYIELTAVERPTPGHHLAHWLGEAEGLRLVILGCPSIDVARSACERAGLAPGPVQSAARQIRYGSPATAQFRWFPLPARDWPEALVAFVQHETRDAVFQPAVCRHANGARGLSRVFYRGERLPEGFKALSAPSATVIEARPAKRLAELFGNGILDTPPLAALGIRVANGSVTREHLAAAGVDYTESEEGIAVPPSATGGVGLLLEPV